MATTAEDTTKLVPEFRVTGHLQVRGPARSRQWRAKYVDRDGVERTKTLGPAWVKDTGRTTKRGGTVWRAADGTKPSDAHLTPKEAENALDALLVEIRSRPRALRQRTDVQRKDVMTLGRLVEAWLTYMEVEKKRTKGTVADARNVARQHWFEKWGEDLPLQTVETYDVIVMDPNGRQHVRQEEKRTDNITTEMVDELRRDLLASHLADRTVQKTIVLLGGCLKLGRRRGWLNKNPVDDAEKVTVVDDGAFNILTPLEFEAVYRAVLSGDRPDELEDEDVLDGLTGDERKMWATALSVAFYAGPRWGELRDLTWDRVDFTNMMLRIESSFTRESERSTTKGKRVRSVPMIPQLHERLDDLSKRLYFIRGGDYVLCKITGDRVQEWLGRDVFYAGLQRAGFGAKREKVDVQGNEQKPMRFHDLRHSYCTWAVNAYDVVDVQRFAGHRQIETTLRYVHRQTKAEHAERGGDYMAGVLSAGTVPAGVAS